MSQNQLFLSQTIKHEKCKTFAACTVVENWQGLFEVCFKIIAQSAKVLILRSSSTKRNASYLLY